MAQRSSQAQRRRASKAASVGPSQAGSQHSAARAVGEIPWFSRERLICVAVAFLLFLGLTLAARVQRPRSDPYAAVRFPDWNWWTFPVERNAFSRTPDIVGTLHQITGEYNTKQYWAVGRGGLIVHSADDGETWERQAEHVTTADLEKVTFADAKNGWARTSVNGHSQTVLRTTDGGKTWKEEVFRPGKLGLMQFLSPRTGLAFSEQRILRTTDGGGEWDTVFELNEWAPNSLGSVGEIAWFSTPGSIYRSVDGGKKWAPVTGDLRKKAGARISTLGPATVPTADEQERLTTAPTIEGCRFHDSDHIHVWLTGARGGRSIAFSPDAGNTWLFKDEKGFGEIVETPTPAIFRYGKKLFEISNSAHFNHPLAGCSISEDGAIRSTVDGGQSWIPRTLAAGPEFRAIHFQTPDQGWLAGANGLVLRTGDGGRTWISVATGTERTLRNIAFKGVRGWIVGDGGICLFSDDGGNSWHARSLLPTKGNIDGSTPEDLHRVFFVDAEHGWIVGDRLAIFATADGGTTWQRQSPPKSVSKGELRDVWFESARKGWAIGSEELILSTDDGGETWENRKSQLSSDTFLRFIPPQDGKPPRVASASKITDLDGKAVTTIGPAKVSDYLFTNAEHGCALTASGEIHETFDQGRNWTLREKIRVGNPRYSEGTNFTFPDRNHGWVAAGHHLLTTADGGKTWTNPLLKYRRSPAPWYYLSLGLVAVPLSLLYRRQEKVVIDRVAEEFTSDAALSDPAADRLGFGALANGISRYLRNAKTKPPLAMAILGPWGSGKSSLMNLVKADLEAHDFRPVTFNAWHHQKEEQILASLLEAIRNDAVPPFFSRAGLSFRYDLFWNRVRANWVRYLCAFLFAPAALSFGITKLDDIQALAGAKGNQTRIANAISGKTGPNSSVRNVEAGKPGAAAATASPSTGIAALIALAGAIAVPLLSLASALKAWGVDPASLLIRPEGSRRVKDLAQKTGFRHEFAHEFSEVTRALHPQSLVVLIDDLDRCRPEAVREVLESVNFLVASGECFVIIGMDLDRVTRCLARSLKDTGEDFALSGSAAAPAPQDLIALAKKYLEKLIQVPIHVPKPDEEHLGDFIAPPLVEAQPVKLSARFRSLWPEVRAPLVYVGLLILAICSYQTGKRLSAAPGKGDTVKLTPATAPSEIASKATLPAEPAATPASTPAGSTPTKPPTTKAVPTATAPSQSRESLMIVERDLSVFGWMLLGLIPIGILSGLGLRKPLNIVINDRPEFEAAMQLWRPFLIAAQPTPRAVKLFKNRTRLFAMLTRTAKPREELSRREWRRLQRSGDTLSETTFPENVLVGLSAIEQMHPEWLEDSQFFQEPQKFLRRSLSQILPQGVKLGDDELRDFPKLLAQFRVISSGVRISQEVPNRKNEAAEPA